MYKNHNFDKQCQRATITINATIRQLAHFETTSSFIMPKAQNSKYTHLLTEELSLGAFISIKRFLIITSSPAQAAAALTSSSERPFSHKIYNVMND